MSQATSTSQEYTIKHLLLQGQQMLKTTSDSAKLDAQILLSFVINKDLSYLLTWPEKELPENECLHYKALLAKRISGEPIAYLVGEKEFWSLNLQVAPSTLIPRPDTETLVELVLNNHQNSTLSCLDLGTGTGAIALALASEQPNWIMNAVDYNEDAVLLAQLNADKNCLPQVKIYQSDWFSNVDASKQFDVIVSNPPYIDEDDHHLGEGDVRFEPLSALVAKNKGYADIEHIIASAKAYFADKGYLYLEHGFEQAKQVRELLAKYGYSDIDTEQDLAGNDRITYAQYEQNSKIVK